MTERKRKEKLSKTTSLVKQNKLPAIQILEQPEAPEVVATRQLTLANQLSQEADLACQNKELERAHKLRDRVEERLSTLVKKYSQTEAADKAQALLKQMRSKSAID